MKLTAFLEQIAKCEVRHTNTAPRRQQNIAHIHRRAWGQIQESTDRLARRLASKGQVAFPEAVVTGRQPTPAEASAALERVIAENELVSTTFLFAGAAAAQSVGRVVIRNAARVVEGYGTGFLVSPRLLLTNNHVLGSAAEAAASSVQFRYWVDSGGRMGELVEVRLDPTAFFRTDAALDFTLVAVSQNPVLDGLGWCPLIEGSGKSVIGEAVNIVQHPGGERQQVVVRENRITNVVDEFLHYEADTQQGSSGSPVFNVDWELAALHHAGVPARDAAGQILLVDGTVWDRSPARAGEIKWMANEGVRISSIVGHLRGLNLPTAEAKLFDAAFEPRPEPLAVLRRWLCGPGGPNRESAPPPTTTATVTCDSGSGHDHGVASVVIPLRVSISLGGTSRCGTDPRSTGPGNVDIKVAPPPRETPTAEELLKRAGKTISSPQRRRAVREDKGEAARREHAKRGANKRQR